MESIKINGMSCQHCVASVTKALEAIPEVSEVSVDLSNGSASFNNTGASRDSIKKAISRLGLIFSVNITCNLCKATANLFVTILMSIGRINRRS